jgi:addiction module HigA family antidote
MISKLHNTPYPGKKLEEKLELLGMQQTELAKRTGITPKTINSIIKGVAPISPETAIAFESVFGVPSASDWLKEEADYQLFKVGELKNEDLHNELSFLDDINYQKMMVVGWIKKIEHSNKLGILKELYKFFGITSQKNLSPVWSQLEVNYRTSTVYKQNNYNIMAWLRRGEKLAQALPCKPYDVSKFKAALLECKKLTTLDFADLYQKLQDICSEAGVAVVFVKEDLPQVATSGAAHWLDKEKALIQLSLRGKADDKFWFNFFHEAGHILLHGRKEQFIDNHGKGLSSTNDKDANTPYSTEENKLKEAEADEFAGNFLIPRKQFSLFASKNDFSVASVKAFAKEQGVSPGIVVGQLQNKGYVPWGKLTSLKVRYDFPSDFKQIEAP